MIYISSADEHTAFGQSHEDAYQGGRALIYMLAVFWLALVPALALRRCYVKKHETGLCTTIGKLCGFFKQAIKIFFYLFIIILSKIIMNSWLRKGDTVVVKKKYHAKVCISPETRMLVSRIRNNGNIRTVWVDNSLTPYSAIFFPFMLKKAKNPIPA
jgi:predicted membrane protein